MDSSGPADALTDRLDRELRLVSEAIALVAGGGAPRVTVAGLMLGDALLPTVEGLARGAGVRVLAEWTTDEAGLDITVVRRDE